MPYALRVNRPASGGPPQAASLRHQGCCGACGGWESGAEAPHSKASFACGFGAQGLGPGRPAARKEGGIHPQMDTDGRG